MNKSLHNILPPAKLLEENILPLSFEDGVLKIAVPDTGRQELFSELRFLTGVKISPVEMPPEEIQRKLNLMFPNLKDSSGSVVEEIDPHSAVDFVNRIIAGALKSGASDIHFEPMEHKTRVRYRIDGILREMQSIQPARALAVTSRIKIMANLDISEKRRTQDGKIRFTYEGRQIDIRVSTLPVTFGEKTVLRILDKSQLSLDLKMLGTEPHQLEILRKYISLPYGMILVTGPTGSGKTTTLYSALSTINSPDKNILTVEDPVEYNLQGINQCNVKNEIGLTFSNVLRSFLRQDPDVIMVGEIRDSETAEIAIRSALTGHLVFSTLHTNDSISAVTRLVDMGIEPFLIASSLKLVIAQRLVRKLCKCRVRSENTPEGFVPAGCKDCKHTGYSGRTAIFEFLEINCEIAGIISHNPDEKSIRETARLTGFSSLRDSGAIKIKNGITSYEEVLQETLL